jgi:hypothetical protein
VFGRGAVLARKTRRAIKKADRKLMAYGTRPAEVPDWLAPYVNDPVGYARDILGIEVTPEIAAALESLHVHPFRTSVDSGHGTGKTFGAAIAVNHWYDTRAKSWIVTTAPTKRDVVDLLWTEVRLQRQRANNIRREKGLPLLSIDFIGPAAPEMRTDPEHVAKGYTARDANSFQGRHRANMLFIFDEKEGVGGIYWDGAKSMFRPGSGDAWLVIGNPLTTTSRAYQEHKAVDAAGNPTWHRFRISSLNHPNIKAGLEGREPPIPGAVTVGQMDQWVNDWCDPIVEGQQRETDIEWRGRHYRPGPIGEPRILGRRPSAGTYGVWSEALWQICLGPLDESPLDVSPVIGCDVANYGTDYTVFHVRCGFVSLYHESVNGWSPTEISGRLIHLTTEYAAWQTARLQKGTAEVTAKQIAIQIDDDATGRAISSILSQQGYLVRPVNAAGTPQRPDLYKNIRSELWFMAARRAYLGQISVARLSQEARTRIEMQLLAPLWWPDEAGHRVVESKDDLRNPKRLGKSPDDADAFNLAYYELGGMSPVTAVHSAPHSPRPERDEPRPERASAANWNKRNQQRNR